MAQQNSGWVVGAVVVGVIAVAGASGAFNGSATPAYPAGYGSQSVSTDYNPGCYAPNYPPQAYQPAPESPSDSVYVPQVGPTPEQVLQEQAEYNHWANEHPAGSVGNPY